jgi:hypothetical protein
MGKNSYILEKERLTRLKEKRKAEKKMSINYFTNKKQVNNEEVKNG